MPQSGSQDGTPRIFVRPYYGNGCTDCNQILHTGRDPQILFVGGPNSRSTNPRWRMDAKKENLNTPYLGDGWADLDEIWQGGAEGVPRENCRPEFEISKIQDGGEGLLVGGVAQSPTGGVRADNIQ